MPITCTFGFNTAYDVFSFCYLENLFLGDDLTKCLYIMLYLDAIYQAETVEQPNRSGIFGKKASYLDLTVEGGGLGCLLAISFS